MVIMPLYVRVNEGARWLRLTATSYAGDTQLVRVWAVPHPQKRAKLMEFDQFQLQLQSRECLAKDIPPVGAGPYWLAVLAFHKVGSSWERSVGRHAGPCEVPAGELSFVADDGGASTQFHTGRSSAVVSVAYR